MSAPAPNDPRLASPYEATGALAAATRAPGRARDAWRGALVEAVEPGSPAAREGLEPGMLVTHVNGVELRDVITWDWEADDTEVYLEGVACPDTDEAFEFECDMTRELGEDWGVTFDGAVFDGMRLCRNRCTFCFMKMLPKSMRRTLYLRDDDYRLSFLQGNFVTLTNMTDADVERVVTCALSPLNVSLHAVSPDVRARLMGKNAQRGMDALEQILAGGIEVHAQIVLVPGENDGEELERSLAFVEARPLITSLGIVPLGYTRFQDTFSRSYSDEPAAARAVIEQVRPYQLRARAELGRTRFQLADEFYLAADVEPPSGEEYDGYPQYYDGIGMVRTCLDEAHALTADEAARACMSRAADAARAAGRTAVVVSGCATARLMGRFLASTPLAGVCEVLAVKNAYFGGNVDVSGLLTAADVFAQLPRDLDGRCVLLPDVMLNADAVTLDDVPAAEMLDRVRERGGRAAFVAPSPCAVARRASELLGAPWPAQM